MSTVDTSLTDYCAELGALLKKPKKSAALHNAIVNSPFKNKLQATTLDLGIVVLLLADKKNKKINRVALSETEAAKWSLKMTPIPFNEIVIPLADKVNLIAKALRTGNSQKTTDWNYLFTPALAPEAARFNQAGAGIACSYIFPFDDKKDGGALIFSYYQPLENLTKRHTDFMKQYSKMVGEALAS